MCLIEFAYSMSIVIKWLKLILSLNVYGLYLNSTNMNDLKINSFIKIYVMDYVQHLF